jgi:ActR/RegA family two-component response regulator
MPREGVKMPATRILCVDDDPAIREMMPHVLRVHGFDATSVGTVAEALSEIAAHSFDVLISDMDIGQPGDGFTVVSAMRRTHPDCINFIITGYPAFDAALQTIRRQVDEFLLKPMDAPMMAAVIEQRLKERKPAGSVQTRRLSDILHDNTDEICRRIIVEMKGNPELAALPLTDEERLDHTRITLTELVNQLKTPPHESTALPAAAKTGKERQVQEYPIALLAVNARLLQGVIYEIIHQNLLAINLSYLMPDLKRLNEILSLQAEEIIRKYLEAEKRAA